MSNATSATLVPARRRRRVGGLTSVLALAPFIVFCLAVAAYPFAHVVEMALSKITLKATGFSYQWNGLTNLTEAFSDPATWSAIVNTLIFLVPSVAGSLLVGLIVALLIDRAKVLRPLARNVIIWPAIITPVVVSVMWLLILSPTAGGLNKLIETLGGPGQTWLNSGFGAMTSLVAVDVWHWYPIVFLFLYAALKGIGTEVFEAARLDGASEWAIIRRITLPLLAPALLAVTAIRIVMSIKVFDEMYVLTAGGPSGATTLISQRIQIWFFQGLKFGEASAFSVVIIIAVMLVVGAGLLLRKFTKS